MFPGRLDGEGKPVGWELRTFGELVESNVGGDWGKETPEGEFDKAVAIIRGTDIPALASGSVGKVPIRYTTPKKAATRVLRDLDIVIEVSGGSPTQPTGRSLLMTQTILDRFSTAVVCASFCRRFRAKSSSMALLASQHLLHLYSTGGTWEYQNQSTGISNFQTAHFLEAEKVLWPGKVLADLYAIQIEPLVRKSTNNEMIALAAVRDFLLPKLMSGEIRVKDAENIVEAAA